MTAATLWDGRFHLARQLGFEPKTYGLEVRCSIQLGYWRKNGAGDGNRTHVIGLEGRRSAIELHPQSTA